MDHSKWAKFLVRQKNSCVDSGSGEALAGPTARFAGADLIEGLVHFGHDVEAIEDMQGLGASLADDLQVLSLPTNGDQIGGITPTTAH
jgi:hypothetical protein